MRLFSVPRYGGEMEGYGTSQKSNGLILIWGTSLWNEVHV